MVSTQILLLGFEVGIITHIITPFIHSCGCFANELVKLTLDADKHLSVDQVVEVGGEGTLSRSLSSARIGGYIGTIGVLTGFGGGGLTPASVFFNHLRFQGIYVGSREMFEAMIKAIALHRLKPVIHETIPFTEVKRAYELLEQSKHFGKIVISHS